MIIFGFELQCHINCFCRFSPSDDQMTVQQKKP